MDLIYADKNGRELGAILDYELDMAYGSDENSMDVTINLNNHCCGEGYFLYVDGTEYGGVIDKICPDTDSHEVMYSGRSWHGILEGKIIEPDAGQNYLIVTGDANSILRNLISRMGLENLFTVTEEESEVMITAYQFERYVKGYTGIKKMLYANRGKLQMEFQNGRVVLSSKMLNNYGESEEWDSSNLDFSIEKVYRPVNHLVCLGSGDLRERHVIHLFTDENGVIQSYTNVDRAYRDLHYILNKSKQKLFGTDEVAEIYDYGNAENTINYEPLTGQPPNWPQVYVNYYQYVDDKYKLLERTYVDVPTFLKYQPGNWNTNFADYYIKKGNDYVNVDAVITYPLKTDPYDWEYNYSSCYEYVDGVYKSVSSKSYERYDLQSTMPFDWATNYGNYYMDQSDGTETIKVTVSGVAYDYYELQTEKPTDWSTNVSSYFCYGFVYKANTNKTWKANKYYKMPNQFISDLSDPVYVLLKKKPDKWSENYKKYYTRSTARLNVKGTPAPKWEKGKYYTKKTRYNPPLWTLAKRYTKVEWDGAPPFELGKYYSSAISGAPVWKENTYYEFVNTEVVPTFAPGRYFEQFIDHYGVLAANGVEKLTEMNQVDKIEISLEPDNDYDINDIVGARENITGIYVFRPVTKKIIQIKNGITSISYETGG